MPIIFKDRETILNVVNKGIDSQSTCKFVSSTSNFPIGEGDIRMIDYPCRENSCSVEIIDITSEGEDVFDINLYIDDNTVIRLNRLEIYRPINVEARFQISCSNSNK